MICRLEVVAVLMELMAVILQGVLVALGNNFLPSLFIYILGLWLLFVFLYIFMSGYWLISSVPDAVERMLEVGSQYKSSVFFNLSEYESIKFLFTCPIMQNESVLDSFVCVLEVSSVDLYGHCFRLSFLKLLESDITFVTRLSGQTPVSRRRNYGY